MAVAADEERIYVVTKTGMMPQSGSLHCVDLEGRSELLSNDKSALTSWLPVLHVPNLHGSLFCMPLFWVQPSVLGAALSHTTLAAGGSVLRCWYSTRTPFEDNRAECPIYMTGRAKFDRCLLSSRDDVGDGKCHNQNLLMSNTSIRVVDLAFESPIAAVDVPSWYSG